jgi:acyl-coenzyme A synthetase/AMP-(fatty) acid ligase
VSAVIEGLRPLIVRRDLGTTIAWRDGAPISAAQFIADAQQLAQRLPARGRPVNLCQDRYLYTLGLAAALLRRQTSLMPPNALPATLRAMPASNVEPYALIDEPGLDTGGLTSVFVESTDAAAPATAVPQLDAALEAVHLLTSGSTGAPRAHPKRWGALVDCMRSGGTRLAASCALPSLDGLNIVATVPAQHSYGFESSVLVALLCGAAFDASRPFYPADIAAALERLPQPRALVTTPFHLKALLRAGVALPPVDLIVCATAPLSPQLAAEAEGAMSARLIEIYGCTEAGQVATRRTTDGDTWTVYDGLRLWRETGSDDDERFLVDGGHVLEPTPLADVLVLESAERFRLLGRANDLIHVAGKRSSLAHLNFHLNSIEGVEDGAFWLPDDVADDVVRPVAFVVAPRVQAAAIVAALRQRLDAVFVPRQVVHVDALPREATGKLTAQTLQRFALARLGAAVEIAADHPAFDGHFPGHPVLPGVVLLSLVMEALQAQPALQAQLGATPTIEQVKFLAPVTPGQRIRVVLQAQAQARGIAFELRRGSTLLAKGTLK